MLYVMLVGAYPFERPEDKHDNQKLQKMIQACTVPFNVMQTDHSKAVAPYLQSQQRHQCHESTNAALHMLSAAVAYL